MPRRTQYTRRKKGNRLNLFLLLAAAVFILTGCANQSVERGSTVDDYSRYLDGYIPRLMDRYSIPGCSIAIITEGRPVWYNAYGYADLAAKRRMTVDDICRAESISKSVTAWGMMTLVEKGLIDLDTPVEQYLGGWKLPDGKYNEAGVTVRRLLTNSAGLHPGEIGGEYPPGSKMPSLKEYLSGSAQPIIEPGKMFLYSNPGFNLLELLIETVSGKDFAAYMEEEVLNPLGMNDSSYEWRTSYAGAVPTGYKQDGRPIAPYVYPVKGSGGLLADLDDLARFVCAGMTGPYYRDYGVLSEAAIGEIHRPRVEIPGLFSFVAEAYGYGHFTETLPDGSAAVWHGGQGNGWMTHFHSVPGAGDGIIILTNSQRSWPFMSRLLNDWAAWRGYGSVGMGIISSATAVLWAVIAVLFALTLWQAYRLLRGAVTKRRSFAPLLSAYPAGRAVLALTGTGLIAVIAWRSGAAYRFESSIFPGALAWAEAALVSLGAVLILLALFPRTKNTLKD